MLKAMYQLEFVREGSKRGAKPPSYEPFFGFVIEANTKNKRSIKVYYPEQYNLPAETRIYELTTTADNLLDTAEKGSQVIVSKYSVPVGQVLKIDCCGLKDTAVCIRSHSKEVANGRMQYICKGGSISTETNEAEMFMNGDSRRLQEALYVLPIGDATTSDMYKCAAAKVKAQEIAMDAEFLDVIYQSSDFLTTIASARHFLSELAKPIEDSPLLQASTHIEKGMT
eukprot:13678-Heterococcus_DN1.PRE.4